ncbi:hypothetical protein [Pseudomonas sp. zfem005]|uniref:hypothetical protein n=1 Tax=Pseudomonas sp. zfem005 TaxID=3078200 RepID=UPI002927ACF8|nr:hypothetical protein [Pseudomonas sp. zfem005]MDU9415216.1 hypothetical protein [Pseudomonas sp. zfem005]
MDTPRPVIGAYLHIDGFDSFERDVFNKRQVRAGFRKAGRVVAGKAQMAIALAGGRNGYPVSRSGRLVDSIQIKLSRSGFMVRVAPVKTAAMSAFYPAYLHYGVRRGSRVGALAPGKGRGRSNRRARGDRLAAIAARRSADWRISPRDNYMTDALEDSADTVQSILRKAFARAMFN